jgi:gliding motility associated protien GldN
MKDSKLLFILSISLLLFANNNIFSQVISNTPRNNVYDKIHISERDPIPYPPVREADVAWSKRIWCMLDLRQKMNLPLYFPEKPIAGKISLTQLIWDSVISGELTAYEDEDFTIPMTVSEVIDDNTRTYEKTVEHETDPDRDTTYTVEDKFKAKDVKRIILKEDWFFDKQRSELDQRTIGVCLVKDVEIQGIKSAPKKMFWIYFPEARPIFANHDVFNRSNDAKKMSYDDLFWKRYFSSTILKEENVYDRWIIDYTLGLDALLEAERVKNDLFKFEHDLWEY